MTDEQFTFICDRLKFIEGRILQLEGEVAAQRDFVLLGSLIAAPGQTLATARAEFHRTKQQLLDGFAEWHVPPDPPETSAQ